jgi:hypothetical protein
MRSIEMPKAKQRSEPQGSNMGALPDSQLEKFSQALLVNIAEGMPRSRAAVAAARTAGGNRGEKLRDFSRNAGTRPPSLGTANGASPGKAYEHQV